MTVGVRVDDGVLLGVAVGCVDVAVGVDVGCPGSGVLVAAGVLVAVGVEPSAVGVAVG